MAGRQDLTALRASGVLRHDRHIDPRPGLGELARCIDLPGLTSYSVFFLTNNFREIRWEVLRNVRRQYELQGHDLNRFIGSRDLQHFNRRIEVLNRIYTILVCIEGDTKRLLREYDGPLETLCLLYHIIKKPNMSWMQSIVLILSSLQEPLQDPNTLLREPEAAGSRIPVLIPGAAQTPTTWLVPKSEYDASTMQIMNHYMPKKDYQYLDIIVNARKGKALGPNAPGPKAEESPFTPLWVRQPRTLEEMVRLSSMVRLVTIYGVDNELGEFWAACPHNLEMEADAIKGDDSEDENALTDLRHFEREEWLKSRTYSQKWMNHWGHRVYTTPFPRVEESEEKLRRHPLRSFHRDI